MTGRSGEYELLWKKLNNHFKSKAKFQNHHVPDDSEYELEQAKRCLGGITLPDHIKQAVRIHNGRSKLDGRFVYRTPTTDLLPLDQWHPYEHEDWCGELYWKTCDGSQDDVHMKESLKEDLKKHLKV